jgi:urease beta subunit
MCAFLLLQPVRVSVLRLQDGLGKGLLLARSTHAEGPHLDRCSSMRRFEPGKINRVDILRCGEDEQLPTLRDKAGGNYL